MSLILQTIPGFSDLPDSVLVAEDPVFGLHVAKISSNATFGMVRLEVFSAQYVNGDTVALPISPTDGYVYSRDELLYFWTVRNSTDPKSGWISSGSLWYAQWNVDQATGVVFSEEWYENSSTADHWDERQSNDGTLLVFTIAQRERTNMIMAAVASYTALSEADIATDKPLTQALIQALNDDAKFAVVNSEVLPLGEYTDGQTVTLPVSPVDGYAYSAAECKFLPAWRWTTIGSAYTQPPRFGGAPYCDQLGPFMAAISSLGVVTIKVSYNCSGGEATNTPAGFGRIAAFAFCTRSATPGSVSPEANNFTEIDSSLFFPSNTLRASLVLALKRNIDEAILTPEFFGPTQYADGATIPLPTSAVDGHVYARDELQYVWSWADTMNHTGAPGWPETDGHDRLPLFLGSIDQTTGVVTLKVYRSPPGAAPYDDYNGNARISVIVFASRQAAHPALTDGTTVNPPSDVSATTITGAATKEIAFTSSIGDFTVAHGISGTPISAWIQMTGDGLVRFQTTRYDATNINLNGSDAGLTGYVVITYRALA